MFDSLFGRGKKNQGGGMFSQPSGYYADDHWSLVHGVGGDGYCCRHCKKVLWQEACPTDPCRCQETGAGKPGMTAESGHGLKPGIQSMFEEPDQKEHKRNLGFFGLDGDEY